MFTYETRTDGPPAEPEPPRTGGTGQAPELPFVPLPTPPMPAAGAWQCPGCYTFYPMYVQSCGCQQWRGIKTSNTFKMELG